MVYYIKNRIHIFDLFNTLSTTYYVSNETLNIMVLYIII